MYFHPSHPEAPKVLAEFPRGRSGSLRLAIRSYEGRPYLELRAVDPERGERSVTIRRGELAGVLEALSKAEGMLAGAEGASSPAPRPDPVGADRDDRPRYRERRTRPEPVDLGRLRPIEPTPETFDEF